MDLALTCVRTKKEKKNTEDSKTSKKTDKGDKSSKNAAVNTVDDCEALQKRLNSEIKSREKLDAKVELMRKEINELKDALKAASGNKQ